MLSHLRAPAATRARPSTRLGRPERSGAAASDRAALPLWQSWGAWIGVLVLGSALGLWATAFTLSHRIDPATVRDGPWTTWPAVGTARIDPYAAAVLARSGEVPLAAAVGVAFRAERDSAGAVLSGACAYKISGPVPYARAWTLTLQSPTGTTVENPAHRYGFTSTEVLRREDGAFAITVSPEVHPGNWLPAPPGPFVLMLRLYAASLGATAADLSAAPLPDIVAEGCTR